MNAVAVIPARYASERLPGKPLALIHGTPMIVHVMWQVQKAKEVDAVIVATDDERIKEAIEKAGGKAIMTPSSCKSGSDRVAAAVKALDKKYDIVVNVQGDEPMISPDVIDQLIITMRKEKPVLCSAMTKLTKQEDIDNPNMVKVVQDKNGYALYFSRSPLPYQRNKIPELKTYKHLGIYCYQRDFLFTFCSLPPSLLERAESLEQLRVLEAGYKIRMVETAYDSVGVDTPQDLKKVEGLMKHHAA